jgi:hypothetical protein
MSTGRALLVVLAVLVVSAAVGVVFGWAAATFWGR